MFWNCVTMFSLKRWGNSAETSIEIVLDFFFEAVRKFGWKKFWNCLTKISLKWWRNAAKTCFEIVLQCFCWSDEGIRLRQLLRLSSIFFVEAVRKFGWNKFWNCLTIFSLKWWRNPAMTGFEIVLQCFRWSDEEIQLRRVSKLSYNVFVETTREFGWDKFWDRFRMFPLKWWKN